MLLFRSEEDVTRWVAATGEAQGASVPLSTVWELGRQWYRDRLDAGFRGLGRDRALGIFRGLGLISEFWLGGQPEE